MHPAVQDFEFLPNSARLSLKPVLMITGMSRAKCYRLIAEGKFPRPVKAVGMQNSWRVEALRAWLDGTWKSPNHIEGDAK